MKLTYETGLATLIQFIVLSLLGFANGLNSIVTTCRDSHGDCVSNLIVSLIFFLLTAGWFAIVWVVGYTAQDQRNRRMAQLLIAAEVVIILVALLNAKHYTDYLSLGTSLIDLILAVWIISLAWRLMRAGGNRIVSAHNRPRQRRKPTVGR